MPLAAVAPPRGERGLKSSAPKGVNKFQVCRSPSWGAWIEIHKNYLLSPFCCVAPPRGERGLKCPALAIDLGDLGSLPLVGSVD